MVLCLQHQLYWFFSVGWCWLPVIAVSWLPISMTGADLFNSSRLSLLVFMKVNLPSACPSSLLRMFFRFLSKLFKTCDLIRVGFITDSELSHSWMMLRCRIVVWWIIPRVFFMWFIHLTGVIPEQLTLFGSLFSCCKTTYRCLRWLNNLLGMLPLFLHHDRCQQLNISVQFVQWLQQQVVERRLSRCMPIFFVGMYVKSKVKLVWHNLNMAVGQGFFEP